MKYNLKDFKPVTGKSRVIDLEHSDPYELLSEDEAALVKGWKGLSPQGVALAMCELFTQSYPDWERVYRWCGEGLFEPGKALGEVAYPKSNTWGELEANLKQVTRRFVMDEKCYEYWGRMRSLWRYLPGDSGQRVRRQVYREWDRKKEGTEERPLSRMGMCSLCWRAVPARKGVTSRLLCHIHNWSSKHPDYRRRFRMKFGKSAKGGKRLGALAHRYHQLLEPLLAGRTVAYESGQIGEPKEDLTVDYAWNVAPFLVVRLLPHVHRYLLSKGADLTSTMSIIETLEAPLPAREGDDEITMRSEFYEDCKWFLGFYMEHLIWAEIWLELEANTQRGGRRPGAGRKPKN